MSIERFIGTELPRLAIGPNSLVTTLQDADAETNRQTAPVFATNDLEDTHAISGFLHDSPELFTDWPLRAHLRGKSYIYAHLLDRWGFLWSSPVCMTDAWSACNEFNAPRLSDLALVLNLETSRASPTLSLSHSFTLCVCQSVSICLLAVVSLSFSACLL